MVARSKKSKITRRARSAKAVARSIDFEKYVKLRALIVDKSLSKIASELGLSKSGLSNVMKGRRRVAVDELGLWCDALNVSLKDLLSHCGVKVRDEYWS